MEYYKIISALFILSIYIYSLKGKLMDINGLYQTVLKKNMPFPKIATAFAILSMVFGILSILLYVTKLMNNDMIFNLGKISLITFTLLATYYFHNIFTTEKQESNFFKNLGLIGGIYLI